MPQNKIQFQHGMSLSEFIDIYGTESKCGAALGRARWPRGFIYPECDERVHPRFLADCRQYWQCAHWRMRFTVRSGTLFHGSKRLMRGVVLVDDAVLGGARSGKPGRGSENKAPFMATVEFDEEGNPLHVRFDVIDDLKGTTLAAWARSALDPKVHMVTDGLAGLAAAGAEVAAYGAIIVSVSPASWRHSAASTSSSPTARQRSPIRSISSISASTATVTWRRPSTP
jgi:hypothetical protein